MIMGAGKHNGDNVDRVNEGDDSNGNLIDGAWEAGAVGPGSLFRAPRALASLRASPEVGRVIPTGQWLRVARTCALALPKTR